MEGLAVRFFRDSLVAAAYTVCPSVLTHLVRFRLSVCWLSWFIYLFSPLDPQPVGAVAV